MSRSVMMPTPEPSGSATIAEPTLRLGHKARSLSERVIRAEFEYGGGHYVTYLHGTSLLATHGGDILTERPEGHKCGER